MGVTGMPATENSTSPSGSARRRSPEEEALLCPSVARFLMDVVPVIPSQNYTIAYPSSFTLLIL